MSFRMDDGLYRLRFQHERPGDEPEYTSSHLRPATTALLEKFSEEHGWFIVNFAFSFIHEGDNYCKETGRRKSLTRLAFKEFPDDKASRGKMWNGYWNRNVKPQQKEVA